MLNVYCLMAKRAYDIYTCVNEYVTKWEATVRLLAHTIFYSN